MLALVAVCQGGFFSYQGTTNVPLKFMIDLQPTSRCRLSHQPLGNAPHNQAPSLP